MTSLARYRKFLVALAGALAQLVALGVLHGAVLHYSQAALALLAAVGVGATPNAAQAPPKAPHQPEHAAP